MTAVGKTMNDGVVGVIEISVCISLDFYRSRSRKPCVRALSRDGRIKQRQNYSVYVLPASLPFKS